MVSCRVEWVLHGGTGLEKGTRLLRKTYLLGNSTSLPLFCCDVAHHLMEWRSTCGYCRCGGKCATADSMDETACNYQVLNHYYEAETCKLALILRQRWNHVMFGFQRHYWYILYSPALLLPFPMCIVIALMDCTLSLSTIKHNLDLWPHWRQMKPGTCVRETGWNTKLELPVDDEDGFRRDLWGNFTTILPDE